MPAAEFRRYAEAQRKCSLAAQREIAALAERLSGKGAEERRDAMLALYPGIVERYSRVAALAAAQYLEAERRSAGYGDGWQAALAETRPVEQAEADVRFSAGHLDWEDADGNGRGAVRSLFAGPG